MDNRHDIYSVESNLVLTYADFAALCGVNRYLYAQRNTKTAFNEKKIALENDAITARNEWYDLLQKTITSKQHDHATVYKSYRKHQLEALIHIYNIGKPLDDENSILAAWSAVGEAMANEYFGKLRTGSQTKKLHPSKSIQRAEAISSVDSFRENLNKKLSVDYSSNCNYPIFVRLPYNFISPSDSPKAELVIRSEKEQDRLKILCEMPVSTQEKVESIQRNLREKLSLYTFLLAFNEGAKFNEGVAKSVCTSISRGRKELG